MGNGNAILTADTLLARGTQLAPCPISSLAIGFRGYLGLWFSPLNTQQAQYHLFCLLPV